MNNESSPLISIIVPVYNVKAYLERCFDSIRGQTYRNLEIIVVDDGSTDGSEDICDEYARLDNRIKVIHQNNAGQSAARNKALSVAQGEFLGFVDADDWIDGDMYEFLYNLVLENHVDISICSHYVEKQGKTRVRYSSGVKTVFSRDEAIRALVVDKRVRNYVWDKLFRRQLFNNIRFPIGRLFEDLAVTYQVFYNSDRIVMEDKPKYHYVVHNESSMQGRYNPQREYNLFQSVYEQVHFVLDKGIWTQANTFIVKRGIRFIDHLLMLESSYSIDQIMNEVIVKMHECDDVKYSQLGLSLSFKRYLIYRHRGFYRIGYRFIRSVFKSERHKF